MAVEFRVEDVTIAGPPGRLAVRIAVIAVDYPLAPTPGWFAAAAGGVPVKDGVRFPVAQMRSRPTMCASST